jgi:DnaT-like ssDNA binding protein
MPVEPLPNFYGSEINFTAYCAERAYPVPDGDIPAALIRASGYIDGAYGSQFTGYKTFGREQPRAWPRSDAYDAEGIYINPYVIPIEVEQATYEATLRELKTPGSLTPDLTPGTIKQAVTVGNVSVTYANTSAADQHTMMTVIDGILAPLLGSDGTGGGKVWGVATRW